MCLQSKSIGSKDIPLNLRQNSYRYEAALLCFA
jgi:hypothetical protein